MKTGRRTFIKAAVVAGAEMITGGIVPGRSGGKPPGISPKELGKTTSMTELFLDNNMIEETPGVSRRLHVPKKHLLNPILRKDRWWEDTYFQPYCTMYDQEEKLFKMWMRSGSDQEKGWVDGYAGYTCYL